MLGLFARRQLGPVALGCLPGDLIVKATPGEILYQFS
jgi:hypothetical protein